MLDHLDKPDSGSDSRDLPRIELLKLAQSLNVSDADVMTRAELRAAIDKARRPEPLPKSQPVTWVSVARRLLASIVEQGLHLPDAAALIRGDTTLSAPPNAPPPVATVTLARIYAAQGHVRRAIATLDEVLATDPDHDIARELRRQLSVRLEEERARAEQTHADEGATTGTLSGSQLSGSQLSGSEPTRIETLSELPPRIETQPELPARIETQPELPARIETQPELPARIEAQPELAARSEPAQPPQSVAAPPSEPLSAPPSIPDVSVAAPIAPRDAALLLIETGGSDVYLYWELASPRSGAGSEPYWISVVAHTPAAGGCARDERRFPVLRDAGALKLEGVPRHAVVRAKLAPNGASAGRPQVVAGSVRAVLPRDDASTLAPGVLRGWGEIPLEAHYTPHARARVADVAQRAREWLERAAPAHW